MNSYESILSAERDRQRERERKREGKESGGAIFGQALSWKLQPHYKWRHPENTWIVQQMACVRPSMKPRLCDSVHHPHWRPRLHSDDSGVLSMGVIFFSSGCKVWRRERNTQSQGLHDREWHPFSQWVTTTTHTVLQLGVFSTPSLVSSAVHCFTLSLSPILEPPRPTFWRTEVFPHFSVAIATLQQDQEREKERSQEA